MLNVRNYHIADKAVKLAKKYFNDFDKIVQRLQLVVAKELTEKLKQLSFIF